MADDTPPAKRAKLTFSEHIRVLVGPTKQEFMVHKDVITSRSHFCKAATSERWSASGSQALKLPADDPDVFSGYLRCLYKDFVDIEDISKNQEQVINIYVLADKLGDATSKNIITDKYAEWSDSAYKIPDVELVNHAFNNTANNSQLRRMFVDFYVHEGSATILKDAVKCASLEFRTALLTAFVDLRDDQEWEDEPVSEAFGQRVSERDTCFYQEHDELCLPCASD
ncbi:hypothetical protein LTR56_010755 [Elasticomyces elasticus]|nr:hypothetical protein LTR56_010755 [Elasticomyces elasticus]KAK3667780.1 hypothetical protein LTR22_001225 [Elasticomyces elasticus]KAK4932227.1 hypothetical protein LTR49_001524 [Elasticomyces elasticus]KAK5763393.1 hypothetical protein LTS12_006364 [Elasticomyces elasticus]